MVDEQIRVAASAGDFSKATTLALHAYGAEILAWLVDRLRSETAGSDAFAVFSEDLWNSWATFEWRCSARGWSYILARNAGNRIAKKRRAEGKRRAVLDEDVAEALDEVRRTTLRHLRTTVKDQFRELRQRLSDEDQLILVLRVDRQMAWKEIALITLGDPHAIDGDLQRESARLRKRLQKIKQQLRGFGEEAGVL